MFKFVSLLAVATVLALSGCSYDHQEAKTTEVASKSSGIVNGDFEQGNLFRVMDCQTEVLIYSNENGTAFSTVPMKDLSENFQAKFEEDCSAKN